jgi:hypothetical protein
MKTKTRSQLFILFLLIAGAIIILIFWGINKRLATVTRKTMDYQLGIVFHRQSSGVAKKIQGVDDNFSLFSDSQLGISLLAPRRSYCENTKDGEVIKTMVRGQIIFLVKENDQAVLLKKITVQKDDVARSIGVPYAFIVQDVKNEGEITAFIKARYGEKCEIDAITPIAGRLSVAMVTIKNSAETNKGDGCLVSYITSIMYNKASNKLVAWDGGQAVNFCGVNGEPLDLQIDNSVKFLGE